MTKFDLKAKYLGKYDVAVLGGGIAGSAAAISAAREGARVILVERSGSLGGTLTEGFMPIILDSENKGGLVRELYSFLNEHGMTCARRGGVTDKDGKRIPGIMVDTEGCKYFLDKAATESGAQVLFHSQVSAADVSDGHINELLICTECGNYTLKADVYIDATGNGLLS
jgi:flavin-dependent dehydrogenase